MNEGDSTLQRSWSKIAERYQQITDQFKVVMLKYAPTPSQFDAMHLEIKKLILEGLGEKALKIMADSQMTKSLRTKTPAEKELAKKRSKVVRRILHLCGRC